MSGLSCIVTHGRLDEHKPVTLDKSNKLELTFRLQKVTALLFNVHLIYLKRLFLSVYENILKKGYSFDCPVPFVDIRRN